MSGPVRSPAHDRPPPGAAAPPWARCRERGRTVLPDPLERLDRLVDALVAAREDPDVERAAQRVAAFVVVRRREVREDVAPP